MTQLMKTLARLYQQDSRKLLATLLRILGPKHYSAAEDIVQDTFDAAIASWQKKGVPATPSAWLMLTAKNKAIDLLRQNKLHGAILEQRVKPEFERLSDQALEDAFDMELVQDDQLRLLFWVSGADIKREYRLPLVLKALCGMSNDAISRALHTKNETIKKRLTRAKKQLADYRYDIPDKQHIVGALDEVCQSLYLMFNEGISALNPSDTKRTEMCLAALGYMNLIIRDQRFCCSDTLALNALMLFHFARLNSRFDEVGRPCTLEEQDRTKWSFSQIKHGMSLLQQAIKLNTNQPSIYLLEALIAFEHCRAKQFVETDWQTIIQHYQMMSKLSDSPLVKINKSIALCEAGQCKAGLDILDSLSTVGMLSFDFRINASKAYIYWRLKMIEQAKVHFQMAKQQGLPEMEQYSLAKRLAETD